MPAVQRQRITFWAATRHLLGIVWLAAICAATSRFSHAEELFIDPMFGVSVTNDVQYGTSANGQGTPLPRLLDLYQPTNTGTAVPSSLPAIVLMHGGSFINGDKTSSVMTQWANEFASRGYVAASIDYRLLHELPRAPGTPITGDRIPDYIPGLIANVQTDTGAVPTLDDYLHEISAAVADQAMAVNFLAANAASFGINPAMIAVGGYSAGAVSSLALGAGVVDGVAADVGAVFSLAGGLFGHEASYDSNDPGVFFVHGSTDTTVPFEEAGFLETALLSEGVPHTRVTVPGAGHGSSALTTAALEPSNELFEFTLTQLQSHASVPEPSSVVLLTVAALGLFSHRRFRRNMTSEQVKR